MTTPRRFSRPSLIPRRPNPRSNQPTNPTPESTRPLRLSRLSTAPNSSSLRLRPHSTVSTSPSHSSSRHDHPQPLPYPSPSSSTTPSATSRCRSGNIPPSSSPASRLSFPRLRRGISSRQASDTSPSRNPSPFASSPHLSSNPTWDEDSISRTPAKDKENEWLASLGFDLSLLNLCDKSHDVENRDPNLITAHRRRSSSVRLSDGTTAGSYVKDVRPMWERLETAFGESCCANGFDVDALGEEESSVQLCEEEVRVLQACSPVLAELRQVRCTENSYTTSPVLDTKIESVHVLDTRRSEVGCDDEEGRGGTGENELMLSLERGNEEKHRTPRGQRDWRSHGEGEEREMVVTPGRVRSSRKSRRASARVSTRELKALLEGQERMRLESDEASGGSELISERAVSDVEGTARGMATLSANVVLSPVRATKQMRDVLGSEKIVTPVRRSLRISRRHLKAIDVDIAEHNSARLESVDYAFLPNRSIKERVSVKMNTPLR